ncbi:MAG: hypothetical protein KC547_13650 [Anaerolineae bacterium]|nr:hypothetical protein [Anaerolineae bacterium]
MLPPHPAAAASTHEAKSVYVVVDPPLSIRSTYSVGVRASEMLQLNDRITVDPKPVTAGGYVWRKHEAGWSIESKVSKPEIYLIPLSENPDLQHAGPPVTLPDGETTLDLPPLFVTLPVPLAETSWLHYFGNTRFAAQLRAQANERRRASYNYCQGLHGGLDFGNTGRNQPPSVVCAGLPNGIISEISPNSSVYRPGVVRIAVGIFTIVYGHITNVRHLTIGQQVRPDTILGEIDLKEQFHLHLEVRVRHDKRDYILNPLNVMPPLLRDPLIDKFAAFDQHFYQDETWQQWQTPLDQPVLKAWVGNQPDLIGPTAR